MGANASVGGYLSRYICSQDKSVGWIKRVARIHLPLVETLRFFHPTRTFLIDRTLIDRTIAIDFSNKFARTNLPWDTSNSISRKKQ